MTVRQLMRLWPIHGSAKKFNKIKFVKTSYNNTSGSNRVLTCNTASNQRHSKVLNNIIKVNSVSRKKKIEWVWEN